MNDFLYVRIPRDQGEKVKVHSVEEHLCTLLKEFIPPKSTDKEYLQEIKDWRQEFLNTSESRKVELKISTVELSKLGLREKSTHCNLNQTEFLSFLLLK